MTGQLRVSWVLVLCLAAIGCSAETRPTGPAVRPGDDDDAGSESACIDRDGDGYGRNCSKGKDCDDDDSDITDECRRCLTTTKDCPCRPGTVAQRCVPPVMRVDGGILVCAEGSRYCRDGYWSDCETIGEYVFQAD
jgi:hypothetical protein